MKGQEADTSAFEQSLELMVVARVPDCLCDGFLLIAKYSMNFLTPASSMLQSMEAPLPAPEAPKSISAPTTQAMVCFTMMHGMANRALSFDEKRKKASGQKSDRVLVHERSTRIESFALRP